MSHRQEKTFQIRTLGCKLNQFDSIIMEGELLENHFIPAPSISEASVVVVNTCTVTGKADAQSRQVIRRIHRENPNCRIIVTGCYARRNPQALQSLPEVHAVISSCDELALHDLRDILGLPNSQNRKNFEEESFSLKVPYQGRTRALMKIQDGCNYQCSYCIIPQVRGKNRSLPPEMVLKGIRHLIACGFKEIVLTGINTGDYGKDLVPKTSLLELLRDLVHIKDLGRIRLNSIEPPTITHDLIDFLATTDKIAHHLHIPLQSGSDRILKKMNRTYRIKRYSAIIETLHQKIPDIGIGADVIVGFPEETDQDFQETFHFIKNAPIHFLHVFPFSERPGTPASLMRRDIPGSVIRERASLLRKLAATLGYQFRKRFQEKLLDVIVLKEKRADGLYLALSSNYIHMGVRAREKDVNNICHARILTVTPHDTIGEVLIC